MKLSLVITFVLTLCTCIIRAQLALYNDGALIYAGTGALLHVEGNVENQKASTLQNDGVIELMGNFTNDSMAGMSNGGDNSSTERVYKFIGAGTQLITGNFSDTTLRYFYNLLVDKAASGSAVQLQTDTRIKGSLVFGSATSGAATYTPTAASTLTNNGNQGIIKTFDSLATDHELYLINPAVNALQGYAPLLINAAPVDAYIQNRGAQGVGLGGFARNVSATNAAYIFPVGSTLNGYNATGITFSSLAANPDKISGMFVNAPGGMGYLSQYCNECNANSTGISGFNYFFTSNSCNNGAPQWVILDNTPQNQGYWSYSGNAADRYFMEVYPNSASGFSSSNIGNSRLIRQSGSLSGIPNGDWTPEILSDMATPTDLLTYSTNTGCYAGSGIPGGTYTGFSHFQIAMGRAENALPVELISLTATPDENRLINVKWATALEINNAGFEVLRSEDGTNFQQIAWINAFGTGNSTTQSDYSYDDTTAQANVNYYYKLNQLDHNKTSQESYTVEAEITGNDILTVSSFFPNPAGTATQLIINSSLDEKLGFELYDITGQLVKKCAIDVAAGQTPFALNTSALQQGRYQALIRSATKVFTNTLTIIH